MNNSDGYIANINLGKLCRVCMIVLENDYVSLFDTLPSDSILLSTKMMSFTCLQVIATRCNENVIILYCLLIN